MVQARILYDKIDTNSVGFIDRAMLRMHIELIRQFVYPDSPFDERSFELGFRKLDRDGDGHIVFQDLCHFAVTNAEN